MTIIFTITLSEPTFGRVSFFNHRTGRSTRVAQRLRHLAYSLANSRITKRNAHHALTYAIISNVVPTLVLKTRTTMRSTMNYSFKYEMYLTIFMRHHLGGPTLTIILRHTGIL